jgi:small subunit ribosomal protein S16
MAVRIRLQRHGKKGKPFYHIVVADGRSKRDGRYIERIGSYNPNVNPATIDLNFDRALHWVKVGADPSDTMRAILSYKGVLMKNHLDRGVIKGAMTQEQADAKFAKWLEEKEGKIAAKSDRVAKEAEDAKKKALAAESEALAKKQAAQQEAADAAAAAEAGEEAAAAEAGEEAAAAAEAPAPEAPEAETEAPAEAAAEETPAEETPADSSTSSEGDSEETK